MSHGLKERDHSFMLCRDVILNFGPSFLTPCRNIYADLWNINLLISAMSLIFLKSICIMLSLLAYVLYLCLTDLPQKAPVCVSNKEYLGGIKMLNHQCVKNSSVILASFCISDLSKHKNQNRSVTGVWLCSFYLCLSKLLQVGVLSNKKQLSSNAEC